MLRLSSVCRFAVSRPSLRHPGVLTRHACKFETSIPSLCSRKYNSAVMMGDSPRLTHALSGRTRRFFSDKPKEQNKEEPTEQDKEEMEEENEEDGPLPESIYMRTVEIEAVLRKAMKSRWFHVRIFTFIRNMSVPNLELDENHEENVLKEMTKINELSNEELLELLKAKKIAMLDESKSTREPIEIFNLYTCDNLIQMLSFQNMKEQKDSTTNETVESSSSESTELSESAKSTKSSETDNMFDKLFDNEDPKEPKENKPEKDDNPEKEDLEKKKKEENEKEEEKEKKGKKNKFKLEFNDDFYDTLGDVSILVMGGSLLFSLMFNTRFFDTEVDYSAFFNELLPKTEKVSIDADACTVEVYFKNKAPSVFFRIGGADEFVTALTNAQYEANIEPVNHIPVLYTEKPMQRSPKFIFYTAFILFFYSFARKRMPKFLEGGVNNKVKEGTKGNVKFADIAGCDEAKKEIIEFVSFLKNSKHYKNVNASVPSGALLSGPPGTGKTLLAKAVAAESDVPFYSMSGTEFTEMYVGIGASRVRDLFKKARENAPCIIFIDEIEALGYKRSYGGTISSEYANTLNQLLSEMDGIQTEETKAPIVVLGATNQPDVIDPALTRPGRLDRDIKVNLPNTDGRKDLFRVYLKKHPCSMNIEELAIRLAALSPGFSGADVAKICNEAAINAAREKRKNVSLVDFEVAMDRMLVGIASGKLPPKTREIVAYHEAGHTIMGWFLEHASPILKVTILPRANAMGFAQNMTDDDSIFTQDALLDMICVTLGGRAAEEVFFNKVSTGAHNDLQKVTNLSYQMIATYGMSKALPNTSFSEKRPNYYKRIADETQHKIDEEIIGLIDEQYKRTKDLLNEKKDLVHALVEKLLKDDTVNHDGLVEILGPRPHVTASYTEYMKYALEAKQNSNDVSTDDVAQTETTDQETQETHDSSTEDNNNNNSSGSSDDDRGYSIKLPSPI